MPARNRWIEHYEETATAYASCRFITAIGSRHCDPTALAVQHLHDTLCQATENKPICLRA